STTDASTGGDTPVYRVSLPGGKLVRRTPTAAPISALFTDRGRSDYGYHVRVADQYPFGQHQRRGGRPGGDVWRTASPAYFPIRAVSGARTGQVTPPYGPASARGCARGCAAGLADVPGREQVVNRICPVKSGIN